MGKRWKKARRMTPLCLFRTLWKVRNRRSFEDAKQSNQAMKSSFMCIFLDWARANMDAMPMSMIDFVDWLNLK